MSNASNGPQINTHSKLKCCSLYILLECVCFINSRPFLRGLTCEYFSESDDELMLKNETGIHHNSWHLFIF